MSDTSHSTNAVPTETSPQPRRTAKPGRPPSSTDDAEPSRKRLKAARGSTEDDEKKRSKRGRPRLDTNDESAADRRRTQIRLAQRAYRERKDSAITVLEKKVKELEKANQEMSQEFTSFHNFILSQGILNTSPEVSRRLNNSTKKFMSLTNASDGSELPVENTENPDQESGYGSDLQRKDSEQGTGTSGSSITGSVTKLSYLPDGNQSQEPSNSPGTRVSTTQPSHQYETIARDISDSSTFFPYSTGSEFPFLEHTFMPSPHDTLPIPSSYSFLEPTLGRRLQRLTIEAGYRLVTMPNPEPQHYASVFGFCLLFESREDIKNRLASCLSCTREESLFYWKFPFTNLGGAGLEPPTSTTRGSASAQKAPGRLPIGNQHSKQRFKPQEMTGLAMGPFTSEVEMTREQWLDQNMRMLMEGFDGRFLDSDEIDAYLQERGIRIPAQAEFVEAEIDINQFQSEFTPIFPKDNDRAHRLALRPPSTLGPDVSTAPFDASLLGVSLPQQADLSTSSDSRIGSFSTDSRGSWSADSSWGKTKVTINVSRLLREIVIKSICLGRSPGVRAKDVDRAVKLSAGFVEAPLENAAFGDMVAAQSYEAM